MKTLALAFFAIATLLGTAGCASKTVATGNRGPMITGTVMYRVRMALPTDAVLTVRLLDTSRADAPAVVLAEKSLSNPGNPPIAFELPYPPGSIRDGRRISLEARIEVGGKLRFYSMTAHPVTAASAIVPHEVWVELVK